MPTATKIRARPAPAEAREPQLIHAFTVRGHGPFPTDMLRLGRCWPASIEASQNACTTLYVGRTVALRGIDRPDRELWQRAGWPVVTG